MRKVKSQLGEYQGKTGNKIIDGSRNSEVSGINTPLGSKWDPFKQGD